MSQRSGLRNKDEGSIIYNNNNKRKKEKKKKEKDVVNGVG